MDEPRYFNRALSWLAYNQRVLGEALHDRHPLLERVRFLAFVSTNLDRFFMVRVAGLHEQLAVSIHPRSPDGLLPAEQLARMWPIVEDLMAALHRGWREAVQPQLVAAGIHMCDYPKLDVAAHSALRAFFATEIFPVLTPLAFDPGHPFPFISNLSLNLAIVVEGPGGTERFARLKVPEVLPRLVAVPGQEASFVWLEQVIAANLQLLFPGKRIGACYPFRVTRDADAEVLDEEAPDLRAAVEYELRQRHFGPVVRLSIDQSMPPRIVEILRENLEIGAEAIYRVDGPIGLSALQALYALDRPDLKFAPAVPAVPPTLQDPARAFSALRAGELLLHHPFESFVPIVALVVAAAHDPQVLAIKMTLYRVGRDSPIVAALREARAAGKQVTVVVEIRARFDEARNLGWAEQLEQGGVHVVYGRVDLKTHAKLLLIVRRERDGVQRYVHLGTGNYNLATAQHYTDLGLLTTDDAIGADVSALFNALTGYAAAVGYRALAVAPGTLRARVLELIAGEAERQATHGDGAIILKLTALSDLAIVDALYHASQVGVQIDLIVRDVCILRPGVAGLSPTIRVRSIVGRFLEHSCILLFGHGDPPWYLCSGALTPSNLDHYIDLLWPVRSRAQGEHLRVVLDAYLRDTANAHLLQADGSYLRPEGQPVFDSQVWLLRHAATLLQAHAAVFAPSSGP